MTDVKKQKDLSGTKPEGTTAAKDAATAAKKRPIETLHIEDCSASIWARTAMNRGKPMTVYSVSYDRSYKDRDGSWMYVKSFDQESLGKVIALSQQASETIDRLREEAEKAVA